jgi:hypothetical protein
MGKPGLNLQKSTLNVTNKLNKKDKGFTDHTIV